MQPLCVLSAGPLHPTTCWIKTGSIWRNVILKWMGHIRLSILFSGLYVILLNCSGTFLTLTTLLEFSVWPISPCFGLLFCHHYLFLFYRLCLHWIDPDVLVLNALVTLTPGDPQPQLWQTSLCFAKWFLKKEAMVMSIHYMRTSTVIGYNNHFIRYALVQYIFCWCWVTGNIDWWHRRHCAMHPNVVNKWKVQHIMCNLDITLSCHIFFITYVEMKT